MVTTSRLLLGSTLWFALVPACSVAGEVLPRAQRFMLSPEVDRAGGATLVVESEWAPRFPGYGQVKPLTERVQQPEVQPVDIEGELPPWIDGIAVDSRSQYLAIAGAESLDGGGPSKWRLTIHKLQWTPAAAAGSDGAQSGGRGRLQAGKAIWSFPSGDAAATPLTCPGFSADAALLFWVGSTLEDGGSSAKVEVWQADLRQNGLPQAAGKVAEELPAPSADRVRRVIEGGAFAATMQLAMGPADSLVFLATPPGEDPDPQLTLWDPTLGTMRPVPPGGKAAAAAMSPDGRLLIAAGGERDNPAIWSWLVAEKRQEPVCGDRASGVPVWYRARRPTSKVNVDGALGVVAYAVQVPNQHGNRDIVCRELGWRRLVAKPVEVKPADGKPADTKPTEVKPEVLPGIELAQGGVGGIAGPNDEFSPAFYVPPALAPNSAHQPLLLFVSTSLEAGSYRWGIYYAPMLDEDFRASPDSN